VARFFGRYEHSLDQKGRVTLPVRYREQAGGTVYVSQYYDRCLALWPQAEFEKQLAEVQATQDRSPEDRNRARYWLANIAEQAPDRQGRVAIPRHLLDYAGLDGAVLLVGALDRIELWNPEAWTARISPYEASMDPAPVEEAPAQ
jgi:MraZ protein